MSEGTQIAGRDAHLTGWDNFIFFSLEILTCNMCKFRVYSVMI